MFTKPHSRSTETLTAISEQMYWFYLASLAELAAHFSVLDRVLINLNCTSLGSEDVSPSTEKNNEEEKKNTSMLFRAPNSAEECNLLQIFISS